ncbi:MAG: peptidoglycan bridge formation glycyltransferase FemA/FemB family protein, partial [Chloroflexota bacterium]|nr:peptidoglycan bridge formation glycyltransferase FemA/FemB family protein [Chloroflexota bacterium]
MLMRIRSSIGPYPLSEEAWNSFVAASEGHILQTWQWGQLKAEFGWQAVRVALEKEGRLVAGTQVLVRSFLPGASIAYIPKGPILNFADQETAGVLLSAIHRIARRKRAVFLKIEPEVLNDPTLERRLKGLGFRPSPQTVQPRRTIIIDLKPSLDDILARMKPKTRYNIRLSARKEVKVQEGTAADVDAFYCLL